jgi:F-type H+-transporting ATPase subunit b
MLIDWFTVGAQTLNFLILVWLMKRFLYKPILDAIDSREQRIAAELADAATKQSAAQQERDDFQQKNAAFAQQRAALLAQAAKEAGDERQRLLDIAREAASALRSKHEAALVQEQQTLTGNIARRTQDEVFAIARKTLTELAGTTLEQSMGEVFIRRLHQLDGADKSSLAAALQTATAPALVRSVFALPPAQQSAIEQALRNIFASTTEVRFETAPALISGIELSVHGCKVAWSIDGYLDALQKSIGALVQQQTGPKSASKAAVPDAPKTAAPGAVP